VRDGPTKGLRGVGKRSQNQKVSGRGKRLRLGEAECEFVKGESKSDSCNPQQLSRGASHLKEMEVIHALKKDDVPVESATHSTQSESGETMRETMQR
jgi:hypothetical protein